MQNSKTLFERGSWSLEQYPQPDADLVDLLVNTIWGTPGKTLYQHLDTRDRILQLQRTHYITLRKDKRTRAGMTLCQRTVRDGDRLSNALYVRYLSFAEIFRKKHGSGSTPTESVFLRPGSMIKSRLAHIFSHPEDIASPLPGTQQSYYYAYVESENERSLQICYSFGYQRIRSFRTLPFSRFFPKKNKWVSKASEDDRAEILAGVEAQYQNYRQFFTDHLFQDDHYFVFKKEGRILAGLRAMPVNWVVQHLPGFTGRLTQNLIPHIPLLSRLFNPKDFRFAAIEGIFYLPEQEHALYSLLESVLAELQLHTALIWLDDESRLFHTLKNSGKLGLLYHLEKPSPVDILVRFTDPSPEMAEAYRRAPVYISALDLT
ncbi:MAG: hypothetical protein R2824_22395 [Saprospiraceae bacterium]|nr:hypothetical protein [Lewinella sp.]